MDINQAKELAIAMRIDTDGNQTFLRVSKDGPPMMVPYHHLDILKGFLDGLFKDNEFLDEHKNMRIRIVKYKLDETVAVYP